MKYRDVIICGSMSFYNEMVFSQKKLHEQGVTAHIPASDENILQYILDRRIQSSIDHYKNVESRIHMKKILRPSTRSILVINNSKKNIDNYIGANTLAEIALAFVRGKKIFLLYDIPTMYYEELSAWGAVPLLGDLSPLIQYSLRITPQQLMLPGINWNEH